MLPARLAAASDAEAAHKQLVGGVLLTCLCLAVTPFREARVCFDESEDMGLRSSQEAQTTHAEAQAGLLFSTCRGCFFVDAASHPG